MRSSLGISAGAAGVCTALVATDDTGMQSMEYRTLSSDLGTHTDLGDLSLSAIGLMTVQVPDHKIEPDAIAVAYRTEGHAAAVRSAAKRQRRAIRLIPETAATLAYLRSTGLVAQYGSIAVVDLGASGLTVTVVDQASGSILCRDRTTTVSGDGAADEPDADIASRVVEFVTGTCARSFRTPEAAVLVGGGGNITDVGAALDAGFDGVTIVVPEPEAATAKGAALLAGSNARQDFPVVAGSGGGRGTGAIVGALVVGGLMLGYGVKEVIPQSEENYAPTGSQVIETPTGEPDVPTVDPDDTDIPSGDPTPSSTVQVPASHVPLPTTDDYSGPAWTTQYTTTVEPPPPTTTPPTPTTTEAPTTTTPPPSTTQSRPWIPPMWPELPTWLPGLVPGVPTPDADPPSLSADPTTPTTETSTTEPPTSEPPASETPTSEPPAPGTEPAGPQPEVSPESGSPTPEVPDSLPR
ncbi:exopolyphosphatase [Rhodococcus sp. W8901]|uniref:exopolyphosphatase n=1 Tax=Rhodococcus sp. W8901 TaxID=2742603 RepID=UPI0015837BD1|nr:exopolyphosphatase [Rhodococcus sp. W8901]QKT12721.1 exopolyphosphatase [Rhodococcus sp. W8901]